MENSGSMSPWLVILIIVLCILGLIVFLFLFRKWMQGGQYTKNTRIDGKTVIITGANSGIGKETAVDLARRGGKIYIACRDTKRGEDALKEIKERSESNNVHLLQLDLSSMESIRQFSKKFHELENHLHILINNAGVMAAPKGLTKDGFEMQIGTNHMGHFLLTNLLLDLLKQSSPSRIVVVSSLFHWYGRINREDLNSEKSYWRWIAYGQSKLANILFARELSKRLEGTGVTVNSLHPGAVKTGLTRDIDLISKIFIEPFRHLVFKTAISGAQTSIRLAVDPELENVTGKYFSDCTEARTNCAAKNDDTAAWLWKTSEEWTGLSMPNTIA